MRSGVNIDCNYIIRVKDYMPLPRPNKRLIDSDGSILPLITVTTEV
jgi:hypothetical protein